MTAHETALEAVRAAKAVETATAELDRVNWLLAREWEQMQQCVKDGEQPRWLAGHACTRVGTRPTFRCGCRQCNEWTSWTEWFNSVGYYHIVDRMYPLEQELRAAKAELQAARARAKALANEARQQARLELGLDD